MSRVSPGDSVRIANQAARVGSIAGGKYGTVAQVNRDTALVSVEGHGARLVVDLADLEVVSGSRAPVDVLAVMDRAHVAFSGEQAREIYEARAAVAELVEAAAEYFFALDNGQEEFDHEKRLRTALAKFGGGQ